MKKIVNLFIVLVFLFSSTFFGALLYFFHYEPIDLSVLECYQVARPTILLDDQGKEWTRFELDKRNYVTLDKMPKNLINAFLSSEDRNFFEHHGLSIRGIIRSTIINLVSRKIVQGASTITQQLVKLIYFNSKKTYSRKLKELLVSLLLEHYYTKEQILETYLNHVYFGCGIYGVDAAAQRFWRKDIKNLTIAQAANLAAVIQCPGLYCPLLKPDKSLERRNIILNVMYNLGHISGSELEMALKEPIHCLTLDSNCCAPHAKEAVRQWLEQKYGKQAIYSQGYVIQTTLNVELQKKSKIEFEKQIKKLRQNLDKPIDGGMVILDTKTGHIKSLIGGYDFSSSKFNRVIQAKRQLGSVFKPFIHAKALEKSVSMIDVVYDLPLEIAIPGQKNWMPQNFNNKFGGPMTLARGLSYSNNIVSIKTLVLAGVQEVCKVAQSVDLSPPGPFYSLALGCLDGTLLEMGAAFNVFANHGTFVAPALIKWVKNERGQKVWRLKSKKKTIFDSYISDQVVSVLSIGMERFKKRSSAKLNLEAFGKSGTTNDWRTNWFCASTSEYTTALYVGCDDNQPLGKDIYPVRTCFPIWLRVHQNLSHAPLSYNPLLKTVKVDWVNGNLENSLGKDIVELKVGEVRSGRCVEPVIPEAVLEI